MPLRWRCGKLVGDLPSGLYRYAAIEHALLELDRSPDLKERFTRAFLNQQQVSNSAVTFIWEAVVERMYWRYTERGYRYLFLDAGHRAIAFEVLAGGTLTQTMVYPRELVHAALRHGAAAVVLTHNHPSGNLEPSRADEALTQTLKAALRLIGVHVLDHIITNGRDVVSMAERGLV